MFGNTDAYLEKFRTCARAQPFSEQNLGIEFYVKEPSKPLFKKHKLLTVHNIYRHRCITELFKIIKHKEPSSLYSSFIRSKQNENRLMIPDPSHNFTYRAPWLWNIFRKNLRKTRYDFTADENLIKSILKKSLFSAQNQNLDSWCNENFTEFGPI